MVVFDRIWIGVMVALLLSMMPAISLIDIRHRIIPNRLMYPSLIAFPVYIVVAWLFHGGTDPVRAGVGFLLFGGSAVPGGPDQPRHGDGRREAGRPDRPGDRGDRAALRGRGGRRGHRPGRRGRASLALVLGRGRKSAIPFGPYLAVGAVVAAFFAAPIASWYLDHFLPLLTHLGRPPVRRGACGCPERAEEQVTEMFDMTCYLVFREHAHGAKVP